LTVKAVVTSAVNGTQISRDSKFTPVPGINHSRNESQSCARTAHVFAYAPQQRNYWTNTNLWHCLCC